MVGAAAVRLPACAQAVLGRSLRYRGRDSLTRRAADASGRGSRPGSARVRAAVLQAATVPGLWLQSQALTLPIRWLPAPAEAPFFGRRVPYAGRPLCTGHGGSEADTVDSATAPQTA